MDDLLGSIAKRAKVFVRADFEKTLIKFIIRAKLPFTVVERPEFQELLESASVAPDARSVKLFSNDTASSQVFAYTV